ncbi:252_t:CDS:2 [Acaulospora colombiana]|uniref:252_t:CDS:1 n=1 Tax=Acaulospora colombiana TaxID=27376 RepID=A0ACA9JVX2_9GLOM|nr:252_t:CDS:2 [Acaulospora colombiana]
MPKTRLERTQEKNLQLNEDFINEINQTNSQNAMQRWRGWSDELLNFLSSPRQIGDIFARTTNLPYFADTGAYALSFSNTPKNGKFRLSQGKVHVAVGFVDLDLLLQATILQNKDLVEQPAKFIGYEGSV